MATQSPFFALEQMLQSFNLPIAPPPWAVEEAHRRVILLLNHVLMQEPPAMERMARQKDHVILLQWRSFTFLVVVTAAGLLDLAPHEAAPDLTLLIVDDSPFAIAQTLMQGARPTVRVAGDVQLAGDVNWLIDHVRWDVEEDLARMWGDVPAHTLLSAVRGVAQALKQFVVSVVPPNATPSTPGQRL